jgi:cyclophilin family peptidyl-prolyl cis-trans isomerase
VRLLTSLGVIDVVLYDATAPISVANFLSYTRSGAYDGSFIHRDVPGFVVQGGGYTWGNGSVPHITTLPPIALEYSADRPNVRGSIAMARTSDLNSATSEWFVNLVDNTTTLGPTNGGGYAVFGRVTVPGLRVVDAIAAKPTVNAGGAFATLPLLTPLAGNNVLRENLIFVNAARVLPAAANDADRVFQLMEAVFADVLKPDGTETSQTSAPFYLRYYAASQSYLGVANGIVYYLVPAISGNVTAFLPVTDLMPLVSASGY